MSQGAAYMLPALASRVRCSETIFVRDLAVEAQVGVHDHERGRRQQLRLQIEVETETHLSDGLAGTVDYDRLVQAALAVAARGHFDLIESFTHAVAELCLCQPLVRSLRLRVEKPEALSRHGAVAGFELRLDRAVPSRREI